MNILKIILITLLATSALCAMQQELLDAVASADLERIQHLIDQNADVNVQDQYRWTPLMKAACNGHTDIVQILIDNQADVNAQSCHNNTPLVHAAGFGYTHIAQLLIANQADVNAQYSLGWTPLMRASFKGHADVVRTLLNGRADLSLQTALSGKTALEVAKKNDRTKIAQMIEREHTTRKETKLLRKAAQIVCAIRTHELNSVWRLIPNELLFLILEHIAPDGFKRLLKLDHDQE